MVVKTDICSFSEFKIYPGHGIRLIKKDGQGFNFITRKAKSLHLQKKRPGKLRWTLAWRRLNKKGIKEEGIRSRKRRVKKVQRAIVGVSLDELKKKREQKPAVRKAQREEALKEVKERKKQKKAAAKAAGAGGPGNKSFAAKHAGKGR